MSAVIVKTKREELFNEIACVLQEWPDLERSVFVRAHYRGQSPESISRSLEIDTGKVLAILRKCDRKLQISLREFRTGNTCSVPLVTSTTGHSNIRVQAE